MCCVSAVQEAPKVLSTAGTPTLPTTLRTQHPSLGQYLPNISTPSPIGHEPKISLCERGPNLGGIRKEADRAEADLCGSLRFLMTRRREDWCMALGVMSDFQQSFPFGRDFVVLRKL